jgi:hypothetical protein
VKREEEDRRHAHREFNAENLFSRVRAMNLATWADGKPILYEYSRLNARLQKASYTVSDKLKILESISSSCPIRARSSARRPPP